MLRDSNLTGDLKGTLTKILQTLRIYGPMPRMELARVAGFSRPTVSVAVQELIRQELLSETPRRLHTAGRPAPVLEIRAGGHLSFGAYLSNHTWTIGVFDLAHQAVKVRRVPTAMSKPEDAVDTLVQEVLGMIPQLSHILPVIGLGVPGLVRVDEGIIHSAPDLGWSNVSFCEMVAERTGLQTVALNRHRAWGLAECRFGTLHKSSVYVGVGTGIAAGIYLERQLVPGAIGGAGEIGHTTVEPQGMLCGCGNYGCLQMYAGGLAIEREYRKRAKSTGLQYAVEDSLSDLRQIRALDICRIADDGDPVAGEVVVEAAGYLGIAIANLVNALNPEAIILGGSIPESCRLYAETLDRVIRQRAMSPFSSTTTISLAALPDYGGALGASVYALDRMLTYGLLLNGSGLPVLRD